MRKPNNGKDLDIPKGLTRKGRKAAAIIKKFMAKNHLETGGCRTFYTPQEWRDRGESYGTRSLLVFVYDGGDLYGIANMHCGYKLHEELVEKLGEIGVYFECCTGWYSAIYEG